MSEEQLTEQQQEDEPCCASAPVPQQRPSHVKLIIQQPRVAVQQPTLAPNAVAFKPKSVQPMYDPQKMLVDFWPRHKQQIEAIDASLLRDANRHQELPLARIKKIMKLDDDVKSQMISAEAPVLFAKAAEIFIEELTLRSWVHTEENKRKTLQKSDISTAISRCEQFDFLIDIVPRDESLHKQTKLQHQTTMGDANHNTAGLVLDQSLLSTAAAARFHSTESTGDGGIQYFIQMPANSSLPEVHQQTPPLVQLQNGQMVQATQIGQPIPFQTSPGQSVQLIAVGSDGQPIQVQLQLPQSHITLQNND